MLKWSIVFVFICVICVIEWMREIHSFKMTHYYVSSDKLKDLKKERKVVFLSDLHNYCYGDHNERLVRAIAEENPDYILVAGDMLVGRPDESSEIAEEFMKQLPEICPVLHANGNHEQRMKEFVDLYGDRFQRYEEVLKTAGVCCLVNENVEFNWDGIRICVHGLELPHEKYKKFKRHPLHKEDIDKLLGEAEECYNIMIAHNPTYMDTYLNWGADLVVSGHLHGGVVRVPFVGGLISPQFVLFPKYSGEMKCVGDKTAVVSKGIGIHTIKVRFMNPAEVVVLHINGSEE